jgi:hypothetical protein
MTTKSIVGAVFSGLLIGTMFTLACAESDTAEGPPLEDGGVIPSDGLAGDAPSDGLAGDADSRPEAGTCSPSKICVTSAPVDAQINLTSIWGSGANDVWAVGTRGSILHYSGTVWEKADLAAQDASTNFTLQSVWLERSDEVWIVDGNRIRRATGWKGAAATEWSFFGNPSAPTGEFIPTAVHGDGDGVWLARGGKTRWGVGPVLMRFEGWDGGVPAVVQNFNSTSSSNLGLSALAVSRPGELWAIGSENVLRVSLEAKDGGDPKWQLEEHDSRSAKALHGVWADHDGVWLVGEGGVLRHMAAGAASTRTFSIVPSPVTVDLYGVFGFGANDVWAVGEASTVLHWNGDKWTRLSTPFDEAWEKPRLLAVWGSSPGDVWIAGNGTLLHFEEGAR